MSQGESNSDLSGLLDAATTQRVYEDAVAPAAKQLGVLAEDVLRGLRLFTLPFQLAAAYHDRLVDSLAAVRSRVPKEKQVEAPPNVAGPVLLSLRFVEDSSMLKAMYLNLLAHAIDRERQHQAHPAYPKIIENLSPKEAEFLFWFAKIRMMSNKVKASEPGSDNQDFVMVVQRLPQLGFEDSGQVYPILQHLQSLGLLMVNTQKQREWVRTTVMLTAFGSDFAEVCVPESWGGLPDKGGGC